MECAICGKDYDELHETKVRVIVAGFVDEDGRLEINHLIDDLEDSLIICTDHFIGGTKNKEGTGYMFEL